MSDLFFITGNKNKFKEAKAIISQLEQLELDLPEIQEIDPRLIIEAKLNEARQHHAGQFVVEDTSLYMDCLGGLPGPLIKSFLQKLGNEGLFELASKYDQFGAVAKTEIGFLDKNEKIHFFTGEVKGEIVRPLSASDFGWDPIFRPNSSQKTFAKMSLEEKNAISMRRQAFAKLANFLKTA